MDKSQYAVVVKSDAADRIQAELFDTKQVEAFPQVKIMRWDNEANLSIRLIEAGGSTAAISSADGIIKYTQNNYECQFKHIACSDINTEGAIDFDVLLLTEPENLELNFSIVGKGLEFLYQAPFDEIVRPGDTYEGWPVESVTPLEVFTTKGKLVASREREDVIGSYAVYWRNCPSNVVGGKAYRIGKLGHIYYPYLIDAKGQKIRAKEFSITYDKESDTGTCKIILPGGLSYPVLVDPTIGYTSEGASGGIPGENIYGSGYNVTTDGDGGVVSAVYSCCKKISNSTYLVAAIYTQDKTRVLLSGQSDSIYVADTTKQFRQLVFQDGPTLSPNTAYFPSILPNYVDFGIYHYYDSGVSGDSRYWAGQTYPNWPATLATGSAITTRWSIYAVYEAATGGVALAGQIITQSGLTAASSVHRALSGAVSSISGLAGASSVSKYLTGVVITKSGLLGALGKQIQVAGQVVTSSALAGALTLSQIIALAGQIITQTTIAGAASVSRALAGQVATASTLAGVPSIARSLAGQISTITASASAPSCIRGLVGAISTESSLHAASSVAKALSGAVVTASGLSAVPGVLRGMAGQVVASSGLAGVPSVARALAGQIITTSGLSGSASTLKALAGVVITSSGLTGALTVVGQGIVALSGAIVTVSSLAGSVAVQKALQGQVITQSALSGTASVIRGLVGQVITATSLTGNGRVVIALSGVVSTVTGLQGALTIAYENIIELAGQVITATGITSALSTIRGLQGQVVTSSGLSGAASLSLALAGQVVTSVAADCSASVSIALAGAISTVTTITGHLIDVFQRVKKAARIDSLMTVYARIDSVVKRFGRF